MYITILLQIIIIEAYVFFTKKKKPAYYVGITAPLMSYLAFVIYLFFSAIIGMAQFKLSGILAIVIPVVTMYNIFVRSKYFSQKESVILSLGLYSFAILNFLLSFNTIYSE